MTNAWDFCIYCCHPSVILSGAQRSRRISRWPVGDPSLSLRMTGNGMSAGMGHVIYCPFVPYTFGACSQHVRSAPATRWKHARNTLRTTAGNAAWKTATYGIHLRRAPHPAATRKENASPNEPSKGRTYRGVMQIKHDNRKNCKISVFDIKFSITFVAITISLKYM